jgi:hypothetical protein
VAVRPFQVNPPAQFLNLRGGTARIGSLAWKRVAMRVGESRSIVCDPVPDSVGVVAFDGGDIVADFLRHGVLPAATSVEDDFGAASGALRFDFELAPGAFRDVTVTAADGSRGVVAQAESPAELLCSAARSWTERLQPVTIDVPDSTVNQTFAAQIAYILVNREGPAIRPGTRSYRRSWIRDGAMTSSALLRTGHVAEARAFLDWFAPHQYASGKIPCVVDHRGADPTPEHDSSGEFVFLVAECLRYDRDVERARALWPRVAAAVGYLDSLRQLRRGTEYRGTEFYGLLPPSISHEGYSAKPMHSYWDDLWALRGFRDAAFLAGELGMGSERQQLAALHADFARDLRASVQAAMRVHRIDYVPGCADLGDFDATSTTIALSPVQAGDTLPAAAVRRTFEKYWQFFVARRDGALWDAFTPYEIRNVGAFVRLGWRDRAQQLLAFFHATQRPTGWRQWPEVVQHDLRTPRFLGDLPHTWVGSDYIRSVLEMLAYEDDAASALVLAHGVPSSWLTTRGVTVRDFPTPYGPLSYTLLRSGRRTTMQIEGALQMPPGGLVVRAPIPPRVRSARVNGARVALARAPLVIRTLPAEIVWQW